MGEETNLVLGWRTVMMGMACLPILICAVLLFFKKIEIPACRYLALFFIAAVLAVGPQIIGYAGFYNRWPNLTYFPLFSTELWLGPLIYLHADRLLRGGTLGWRKLLFLPGIIQAVYYTFIFFKWDNHLDKWAYNSTYHAPYILPLENLLTIGLMIFAVLAIWRLTKKYRHHLEQTQSAALEYDPTWLRNFIIALLLAGGVFSGLELADTVATISYDTAFPFQVISILIVTWIAIESVWRLSKPFPKTSSMAIEQTTEAKDWSHEAKILKEKIKSEGWYLEAGLSIRDVSSRMATNESYVSRSLNQGSGQSFNQFINGLRIEHAKTLINDGGTSILNIAYDSGFNSKATFNRVFKNKTGQTPSQFKSSQNS